MSSSNLSIKATCTECGHEFHVQMDEPSQEQKFLTSQLKSEWFTINGKPYRLTWYDCPSCGKRIFVQCDDWRTEKLLKKCIDVTSRMSNKSTHRWDNSKKQSGYLERLRNDLAESRKRAEAEVEGKQIVDRHAGTAHELVFYHG